MCRLRDQDTVLAIQDGTDLNFGMYPGGTGLQIIGRNQTRSKTLGLHLHTTLAVSGQGLPLGVLRLGFDPVQNTTPNSRTKIRRWLGGLKDMDKAVREVPGKTRVISVCDREGDVFELFDAQRRCPRVELLVRAKHDRNPACTDKLFTRLQSGPPAGYREVPIGGLVARPDSSRKKARPARQKRLARCAVRFHPITLSATDRVPDAAPLRVSGIHLVETDPPQGEKPVEWFLLTTVSVKTAPCAIEMIEYYGYRWRIEEFFRVLKSGCKAEFLLFHTADRLQHAIAINAVIAWRIMVMTRLGREVPETEPELLFADEELSFLRTYARRHELTPPEKLGDAVKLVAHHGGHREGKYQSDPGDQVMWTGYSRLSSATIGHQYGREDGYQQGLKDADQEESL